MPDMEKVIKGLSELHGSSETMTLISETIALLKEQKQKIDVLEDQNARLIRLKNQQPKKAKWKSVHYISKDVTKTFKKCTCCDYLCNGWDIETGIAYDYCPNCGAEMQNGGTNREYKEGEQDG